MENLYKYVGIVFIAVGVISGIYLGTSLKIVEIDKYGIDNAVLNPLRWVYGIITISSSVFFGCVILGIGDIISRLDKSAH